MASTGTFIYEGRDEALAVEDGLVRDVLNGQPRMLLVFLHCMENVVEAERRDERGALRNMNDDEEGGGRGGGDAAMMNEDGMRCSRSISCRAFLWDLFCRGVGKMKLTDGDRRCIELA